MENESKTLAELNSEYRRLVNYLSTYKKRFEDVENNKQYAEDLYSHALDELSEAELTYEERLSELNLAKNGPFAYYGNDVISAMEKSVDEANQRVEELKALVQRRNQERSKAYENYNPLKETYEDANDRINLIMVSFAANPIINAALVNEIESDCNDNISDINKRQQELRNLDSLINSDSKIQAQVDRILTKLREISEKDSVKDFDEVSKINRSISTAVRNIKQRMKDLGLEDANTISRNEIIEMVSNRDTEGKITIPLLETKIKSLDMEIGRVELEKNNTINALGVSLEIGQNPEGFGEKYNAEAAELNDLNRELEAARSTFTSSSTRLGEISDRRQQLMGRLEEIKRNNPNAKKIIALQQELEAIKNEEIPLVDNHKYKSISEELKKLEGSNPDGEPKKTDSDTVNRLKISFESAKTALDAEKEKPSLSSFNLRYQDGDEIVDNPEYDENSKKVDDDKQALQNFNDELYKNFPNLKQLETNLTEAQQELDQVRANYISAKESMYKFLRENIYGNFVSEEIYPGLTKSEGSLADAFDKYRFAELAVRNSFLNYVRKPSEENKKSLMTAIEEYNIAKTKFGTVLCDDNRRTTISLTRSTGVEPSSKAMHDYLMYRVSKDYSEDIPEEYDIETFNNIIAIAKINDKKSDFDALKIAGNDLNEFMNKLLENPVVLEGEHKEQLNSLLSNYERDINALPESTIQTIVDTGLPEKKPTGFFAKIGWNFYNKKVANVTKHKSAFDGVKVEIPQELANQKRKLEQDLKNAKNMLDKAVKKYTGAENALNDYKNNNNILPGDLTRRKELQADIKKAEEKLNKTPKKINKTALKRLQDAFDKAKEDFEKAKGDSGDSQRIEQLRQELKGIEEKIPDPDKEAEKQRRIIEKNNEIKVAGNSETQKEIDDINSELAALGGEETAILDEKSKAQADIDELSPKVTAKQRAIAVFEIARKKIGDLKNLIRISDGNRFTDRRIGNPANELAEAVKNDAKERGTYKDDSEAGR